MLSLRFLPLKNLPAALRRVFCQKAGREQRAGSIFVFFPDHGTGGHHWNGKYCRGSHCHGTGRAGRSVLDVTVRDHRAVDQTGRKHTVCQVSCQKPKGEPAGGPMYVLQNAFPQKTAGRILAMLFAAFAVLASFGMGNMTQGNSIAEALSVTFQVKQTVTGIVLSLLTILVILGGIGTIAKVTEYLVPCMAVFYLFGTGMVIFTHFKNLPAGVVQILWGAFCPEAMTGGAAGMMLAVENGIANSGRMAMRYGVSRGVFSNEAGLGAAGISAAAADTSDAVHQGYISMTGVFIDTIVICSLTGLAIAASGMLGQRDPRGEVLNGTALMIAVFSDTFGRTGEWMLTISIVLFAFATIIAWEYQGEKAFEYLTGGCDRTQWYRLGYGLVTFWERSARWKQCGIFRISVTD